MSMCSSSKSCAKCTSIIATFLLFIGGVSPDPIKSIYSAIVGLLHRDNAVLLASVGSSSRNRYSSRNGLSSRNSSPTASCRYPAHPWIRKADSSGLVVLGWQQQNCEGFISLQVDVQNELPNARVSVWEKADAGNSQL